MHRGPKPAPLVRPTAPCAWRSLGGEISWNEYEALDGECRGQSAGVSVENRSVNNMVDLQDEQKRVAYSPGWTRDRAYR